jgi:hypothetical protein
MASVIASVKCRLRKPYYYLRHAARRHCRTSLLNKNTKTPNLEPAGPQELLESTALLSKDVDGTFSCGNRGALPTPGVKSSGCKDLLLVGNAGKSLDDDGEPQSKAAGRHQCRYRYLISNIKNRCGGGKSTSSSNSTSKSSITTKARRKKIFKKIRSAAAALLIKPLESWSEASYAVASSSSMMGLFPCGPVPVTGVPYYGSSSSLRH